MQKKNTYKFQSFHAGAGVSVHVLPTRKFKTTTISLIMGRELDEHATHAALLAEVLKRAGTKYPDMRAIAVQMERMYGAAFGCGIARTGGRQALMMRLTLPGENFLPRKTALTDKGFDFLREMLLRPLARDGAFDANVVRLEKHNLRANIASLMNNKMAYAQRRCIEEMCKKERFRFYEHGDIEKVSRISPGGLYKFYTSMLAQCPIDVFVVGDVTVKKTVDRVEKMFRRRKPGGYSFDNSEKQPRPARPRRIVEKQSVAQAKLCVGTRTYTSMREPDYPAAVCYNGLLGAFSHSKLFRHIRENAGLAYDAHSSIESSKGLVLIGIGLEGANYNKALRIIRQQMGDLRDGKISRDEMAKTRKNLINRLQSSLDSPTQLINFHYSQMINDSTLDVAEWVEKISAVKPAQVRAVARKTIIDTIFLLAPEETKRKK